MRYFGLRRCEICGAEYQPNTGSQRFCPKCGKERDKERKQKWYKEHYPDAKPKVKTTTPCCVCGGPFAGWFDSKPYCNKHWLRLYNNGTTEKLPRKRTSLFEVDGDVLKITTAKGEVVLADAEDLDLLKDHSWCVSLQGYAVSNIGGGRVVKIDHLVLGLDKCKGKIIDHKNHNKLDNRKCNLRFATVADNVRNASKVKGSANPYVGIRLTKANKYCVRIGYDYKEHYVGTYNTLEEAIAARKQAELKYHGEFAQHLSSC